MPQLNRLFKAYYGKQSQADGVEDEERIVQMNQILTESNYPKQGKGRTDNIDGPRQKNPS